MHEALHVYAILLITFIFQALRNTILIPLSQLSAGSRESLEFEWQLSKWSECSQTCSFTVTSSGFQVGRGFLSMI